MSTTQTHTEPPVIVVEPVDEPIDEDVVEEQLQSLQAQIDALEAHRSLPSRRRRRQHRPPSPPGPGDGGDGDDEPDHPNQPPTPPPVPPPASPEQLDAPPAPPLSNMKMAKPDDFDGNPDNVDKFIHQCNLYLANQPSLSHQQQILFALSYMKTGAAYHWAYQRVEQLIRTQFALVTWRTFQRELREAFGDTDRVATARLELQLVKQGSDTVDNYNIRFSQYSTLSGFGDIALIEMYKKGLNLSIINKVWNRPPRPVTLSGWKRAASEVDHDARELRSYQNALHSSSTKKSHKIPSMSTSSSSTTAPTSSSSSKTSKPTPSATTPSPAPIKVKREEISSALAAIRREKGQCLLCGSDDHWANVCPKKTTHVVGKSSSSSTRGRGRGGRGGGSRTIRVVIKDSTADNSSKDNDFTIQGMDNLSNVQKAALSKSLANAST